MTTTRLDVEGVLGALTLEEKAHLVEGFQSWRTGAVERLGIESLSLTDGPHGVRKVRAAEGGFDIADNHESSCFPTASAVAASWDAENARRIGEAIGREAAALGVDVLLAPGVNLQRDPRCGRNFEYFSEDPLVTGMFGSAFVRGVQSQGVAASVKHFAANSNEEYRFVGDSVVDERALRELYLRGFERIVKDADPATVMCAYNRLNGTFCSEHRELLTGILREEWGFDGLVMTDWGATHDRVAGIHAGLDLDMPGGVRHNREAIIAAVTDGSLAEADLDRAVRNVLRLVGAMRTATRPHGEPDTASHARLAREIAADAAVLLRNDGTLPLRSGRLAVVGELFERLRFQGAGSSLVTPGEVRSARDAFDARGVAYHYARGYRSLEREPDPDLVAEALATARGGDAVLFFGGLSDLEESEGFDRPHLRLGKPQTELLTALIATGVPVVLVLHAGAPVELPFLGQLAAVLLMHLPGMQGGEATADLLFGDATPSGRLTQSWPRSAGDIPAGDVFDRSPVAPYYESIYVGYRFHDRAGTDLLFPFGFGLSYTTFAWRDLRLERRGDLIEATLTVENTGPRPGAEVVQLYVRNAASAVFKADKELRAFTKVRLAAGAGTEVTLGFALADLRYWDVTDHDWVLENGGYEVLAAASAVDVRLSAPLSVADGRDSRSPYPAVVDLDYASPPGRQPASFPALLGRPLPQLDTSGLLSLETRLADARRSLLGRIVYAVIVGHVRRQYRQAEALPESPERDARVKNTHFVLRMLPTGSLRSLAMASSGQLPYHLAAGIADLGTGHPLRGMRTILTGRVARSASVHPADEQSHDRIAPAGRVGDLQRPPQGGPSGVPEPPAAGRPVPEEQS